MLNYYFLNLFLFLQKSGGGGAKVPPAPPFARSLKLVREFNVTIQLFPPLKISAYQSSINSIIELNLRTLISYSFFIIDPHIIQQTANSENTETLNTNLSFNNRISLVL